MSVVRLCTLLRRLKFSAMFLRHLVHWLAGDIQVKFYGDRDQGRTVREFPGISEILAGITGNFASFVFFSIFIVDYDILVFNLTAF